jgi:ketosteroid isomerase-like protein
VPFATPEPLSLLAAYAAAVDARDLEALRHLFLPDATLAVRRGDGAPEVHEGHAGLADVIAMLSAFEATLHEVSSVIVEIDEDGASASGTSVCVAHHVRRREGREGEDLVLHGRYTDRFARDGEGAWRFASRELRVLWTEKRPVRLA